MKKVFISYSYQDHRSRNIVMVLRERLCSLGVETVLIFDVPESGSDWQKSITEQINKCSIFVCFFEIGNPNLMFELGYALAKNMKIIIVGDLNDLPADLRNMTYIPREAHPHDVLSQIEKYLSEEQPISKYFIDKTNPESAINLLIDRPELLDNIEPPEFENLVMQWFLKRGYDVESSIASWDYGYDFVIYPFRGSRAVVEVKKYKSTSQVPLAIIRQLVGSMAMERIPYGIIVSTAQFTKSARYFVENMEHTVFLWTLEDLSNMAALPNAAIERTP